jgi:hypothetical protein
VSASLLLLSGLLAAFAGRVAAEAPRSGFETVGLYVWRDTPFALPEPPAAYLARLQTRLEAIPEAGKESLP